MQTVLRNVLLLEDQTIIAIDIEDTLKSLGAQDVHAFDSNAGAMGWLEQNTPSLAIIDPRLRDGFCIDVAHVLINMCVPFVVYSGDSRVDDIDHAFESGVWLTKPAPPEALCAAIEILAKDRHDGEKLVG